LNPQIKINDPQAFLESLGKRLTILSKESQVAFSASCCERAYPNYKFFSELTKWGDPVAFRNSLDLAWGSLKNNPGRQLLSSLEQACIKATPDLDDFSTEELDVASAAAQDSAFMIILLLQLVMDCEEGQPKRIATFARDTVDTYVQALENISPTDLNLEHRIADHPLMRRELSCQKFDLEYLENMNDSSQIELFRINAIRQPANLSPSF
jgi:uncharacterized protein YjaG (DUF416 family)